ncbi:MAG: glycosyltransferase family 61 protein [Paracoccus sp. (in: a-proteobacteria)]|uniref:glycosyltransferase 61 family protein n=1 Tax=Paracoccus sp. TaxID=267 RepID=UPI0039E64A81
MAKFDEGLAFLMPGTARGFRPAPRSTDIAPEFRAAPWLGAIVASEHEAHALDLYRFVRGYREFKTARNCVLFKSFPVLVENFEYYGKIPMAREQIILSGASALRVRMKLAKKLDEGEVEADLGARRQADGTDPLHRRAFLKPRDLGLPFLIECRNFFNFYHFTTESLIYLQMYRDYGLTGPIWLFTSSRREGKAFIRKAVRDFYPDLADRVEMKVGSLSVPRAIIPFNTNHLYHQTTAERFPDIELEAGFARIDTPGALRPATVDNYKFIYNNSRDEYIDRHREQVLAGLPSTERRRLYVGRRPGAGKDRPLLGEKALVAMLARYGFAHVYLEDYSPGQQAQLCQDAEILVSAHGAGFANMTYARPGAWFIELSHLQTARHRFGDFNMHASVSGARYMHFFADHDTQADEVPSMEEDGHAGIAMSAWAIDRLEGLIAIIVDPDAYRAANRGMAQALKRQRPEQALALLAEKPAYAQGCARICALAADAALAQGDPQVALAHLAQALRVAPYRADLWERRHDLAKSLGREAEAQDIHRMMSLYHPFRFMRWTRDGHGVAMIQAPKSAGKGGAE